MNLGDADALRGLRGPERSRVHRGEPSPRSTNRPPLLTRSQKRACRLVRAWPPEPPGGGPWAHPPGTGQGSSSLTLPGLDPRAQQQLPVLHPKEQ